MLLRVFLMLKSNHSKMRYHFRDGVSFLRQKRKDVIRRLLRMLFFHGTPEMKTGGLGFRGTIRLARAKANGYTVSGRGLDNKTTHSQCFVRANISTACTFWAV
mgnify:CR=1 FL=1